MPLSITIRSLIHPRLVLDLPPLSKNEGIARLCQRLATDPRVRDGEALKAAMLAREAVSSTGIGSGLAIPHVKIPQVSDFILALGRSREGIEFGSIDRRPVNLVFMLAASDQQTRSFIHVLAKITEVMREDAKRQALLDAPDPDSIIQICRQYEW